MKRQTFALSFFISFFFFFFSGFFQSSAWGEEKILFLQSEIHILSDGSLMVSERISLQIDGMRGVEGFKRTFSPSPNKSEISIHQLLRNGNQEVYRLYSKNEGAFLETGKYDVFLQKGKHTYTLKYKVKKAIPLVGEKKEFLWDATGKWNIPVERVEIKVIVPPCDLNQMESWCTLEGGKESKKILSRDARENHFYFFHSTPLSPGNYLQIYFHFPQNIFKGNVSPRGRIDGERILNFESEIRVEKNGWISVQETIQVVAGGQKIRRGIYRDFPTQYQGYKGWGVYYVVPFQVEEVLRNGSPEAYHILDQLNGKRVYIGNKDVFLSPGIYTYTLKYRTSRQIGFFEDHDEFTWNVTGAGWEFPMEKVSARILLPPNISRDQIKADGFTGTFQQKGKDFKAWTDIDGNYHFQTLRPLSAKENLTFALSFPKGHIEAPSAGENFSNFLEDNQIFLYGFGGLLILIAYYIVVWYLFGRDPRKGTIVPRFHPPTGLSPAAVRFIYRMGFDSRCFNAAILNMAVKRFLKIEQEDKVFTLKLDKASEEVLSPGEKQIAKRFFPLSSKTKTRPEIVIGQGYESKLKDAWEMLKFYLQMEYEKKYFITNSLYFAIGVIISIVVGVLSLLSTPMQDSAIVLFMTVWLTFWSFGVFMLLLQCYGQWKMFLLVEPSQKVILLFPTIFLTIFSIPFVMGEILGFYILFHAFTHFTAFILIAIILMVAFTNVLFYHLLKAPTRAGRRIMDEIEGFKMYLATAEKDFLERATRSPDKAPEVFEKLLPYALALDVENQWAEKFSHVFSQSGTEGSTQKKHLAYSPVWYRGTSWNHLNSGNFASSFDSSISGGISSSMTAPGSSSGFSGGGGGFSGGGGGGGGGGGW